jgi:hypothetical protein
MANNWLCIGIIRNAAMAHYFVFARSERGSYCCVADMLQWACKSTDTLLCSIFYIRLYKLQ